MNKNNNYTMYPHIMRPFRNSELNDACNADMMYISDTDEIDIIGYQRFDMSMFCNLSSLDKREFIELIIYIKSFEDQMSIEESLNEFFSGDTVKIDAVKDIDFNLYCNAITIKDPYTIDTFNIIAGLSLDSDSVIILLICDYK